MTSTKRYPFSAARHGHDIEFYRNRLWLTMRDMEDGEIPMDDARYDRICNMYYGALQDLTYAMYGGGPVVYLTGEQIGLAKKIVAWASNTRAGTCIANGRPDLVQYC